MNYYKIYGADNFEHVNFLDESYYEKLTQLKNQKTIEFGDKPQVELVKPDWRQKAKKADFPGYGTNFIFMRDYVYDKDKAFFEQFGVLFPVYSNKGDKLYVFNCDLLEDALDEEKSEFVRFDSGKVMMVEKHVFKNTIPESRIMFRIPYTNNPIIVTDKFIEYYNANNYNGMNFKKLHNATP